MSYGWRGYGDKCAKPEVVGSSAAGREAHVFHAKNCVTSDLHRVWLPSGSLLVLIFLLFSQRVPPSRAHHCRFGTVGSNSSSDSLLCSSVDHQHSQSTIPLLQI